VSEERPIGSSGGISVFEEDHMKVSELTGAQLDYWVARAEGHEVNEWCELLDVREPGGAPMDYHPSTDWAQVGPLIEKYGMYLDVGGDWEARCMTSPSYARGDTPLQAICRAVVRAAFGDDVDEVALRIT
jgi:hypothetical protein